MYTADKKLYVAHGPSGQISIEGSMANRHGLIAGATGTPVGFCSVGKARMDGSLVWLCATKAIERHRFYLVFQRGSVSQVDGKPIALMSTDG